MSQDTKTALLDVAEHAARARGIDGFSYADLAEAVGIRKASIHYHFPSKDDLSQALIERYSATLRQACLQIDRQHATGAARLKALVAVYRAALNGGETLCLCIAFTAGKESLPADVVAKVDAFRDMMLGWITELFELGLEDGTIAGVQDPSKEARATLALLEGAHLAARAAQDVAVFDQATDLLVLRGS